MTQDPLLNQDVLKRFLRAHQLPTLDRFGQHFLVDGEALERIVRAIAPNPDVPLIEVGAGLGVLTCALARAREREKGHGDQPCAPLVAVELDRRLIPTLTHRVAEFPSVRVIQGDILKLHPRSLFPRSSSLVLRPYAICGNIPYGITSRLLRHVLSWSPPPTQGTFLLDAAVARRVTAAPPALSVLAITVQVVAEAASVGDPISGTAFLPPPAVMSAIVRLTTRPAPLVPREDQREFFRLVHAGFSQKRKTLQNALAATWRQPPSRVGALLHTVGIDPKRRAQTLTIEEWKTLLAACAVTPHEPRKLIQATSL